MKGLLIKDWYMIRKYCRVYLLIAVVFTAVSAFNNENFFFAFYPGIMCGMIPVTLIGYEERCGWLPYSCTLPYDRKQLVTEKYLVGLIVQAAVLILTGSAQFVRMKVFGTFEIQTYVFLMIAMLVVTAAASSVSMPFIFKYGVEKGRIAYYVMVGFVCALSLLVSQLLSHGLHVTIGERIIFILTAAAGVCIYFASWYLSVVLYEKREL